MQQTECSGIIYWIRGAVEIVILPQQQIAFPAHVGSRCSVYIVAYIGIEFHTECVVGKEVDWVIAIVPYLQRKVLRAVPTNVIGRSTCI